jgi:hypothetical protein
MGAHPDIFSVREPAILRTLAQARAVPEQAPPQWTAEQFDRSLGVFLKLWSRKFRNGQISVVKATSFASDLATEILARPSSPRATFMYVSLESYLATILGAEHSPNEARALAPLRLKRLNARLGSDFVLAKMSIGEIVALGWACEMLALIAAAQPAKMRVHWLDFDAFLSRPNFALASAFQHFGVSVRSDQIDAILSGPIMRRYSKAQEYEYDTASRSAILNQSRSERAPEIRSGLNWIKSVGIQSSSLWAALDGFVERRPASEAGN